MTATTQVIVADTHSAHVGYPGGPAVAIRPGQRGGVHLVLRAADGSEASAFLEADQAREVADAPLDSAWRDEQRTRGREPGWVDAAYWSADRAAARNDH